MHSGGAVTFTLDAVSPAMPNGWEKFFGQAIHEAVSSLSDVTQGLLVRVLQGPCKLHGGRETQYRKIAVLNMDTGVVVLLS